MATRLSSSGRSRRSSLPAQYALPADRVTTWSLSGVTGGIPVRSTIYATINASTYTGVNASAGIQAALDACPAGQVVLLSSGTFIVNDLLLIWKGITLRGAGANVTILNKANGAHARTNPTTPVDPGSYSYNAQPIVIVGPQRYNVFDDTTAKALSVDGVKGAFSVTVSDGSGFAAGQFVMLDEKSGATWQDTPTGFHDAAKVWTGDRVAWNMHWPQQAFQDDCQYSDATSPYQDTGSGRQWPDSMSWFSRFDRPTNEIKEVASVAGNVVTFTTPLHISYRTSHTAQLTRATGSNVFVQGAGVEDLCTVGGADGQIRFTHAAKCWAKNVEVTQWIGEGIAVDSAFKIELRGAYIHDGSWPEPGGAGYAISFAYGSSEILVENSISINTCKNMVARSCGACSVFGYNYTDDAWDFDTPTWQECGLNASHMAGPHHVLFEGNYGQNFDSDYTHGNAIYMTIFRNHLTGQRRSFTDTANVRCAGLAYGSWWASFAGNVLGRSGQMGAFNYQAPAMTSGSVWTGPNVWQIGYDPERFNDPLVADPLTMSTLIRDGNWDFKQNAQTWHNASAIALPDSLYLSAKPAFFGSKAWPWVNPVTGATTDLPSKLRYDNSTPNDMTPP